MDLQLDVVPLSLDEFVCLCKVSQLLLHFHQPLPLLCQLRLLRLSVGLDTHLHELEAE